MKFIGLVLAVVMSAPAFAGFRAFQDTQDLRIFDSIMCSTGMSCTRVGQKMKIIPAPFVAPIAATATTITAAQCGSTFQNSGAVVINLPEASAVIGCVLTFITANASNFDVNPDNADQILVQTNAAGDAIRNATLGNSIMLKAISASQWTPVAIIGTWTDIN